MLKDLSHTDSLGGIFIKHFEDQLSALFAEAQLLPIYSNFLFNDHLPQLFFIGRPEGQHTDHQPVEHHADAPDIDFGRRLGVAQQHLWRHVLQAPSVTLFPGIPPVCPKNPKVHNFQLNGQVLVLGLVGLFVLLFREFFG